MARSDFGGHAPKMGGRDYGGRAYSRAYSGPRYASRDFDNRAGPRGDRGRYAERHDRGDRFEHRRFAERDHDRGHDFDHRGRHRVWVWVYGPDYYAYGDDCWWLLRQAQITGSPYWWSRYNYCVGYY
jgi:hypothetical protein